MRIFIRMLLTCWAVMLILASFVLLWPSTLWPLQDGLQRSLPLHTLESCAERAFQQDRATGAPTSISPAPNCFGGHLVASGVDADTDLAGNQLSDNERLVASRTTLDDSDVIQYLASGTVVAFRVSTDLPDPPLYVVTVPLSGHLFMTREFDRASKAILITGLLSLLVAAYFVRPIARLNGVAERFGKGDLKVRVAPSLLKRKDELGDLGRTFNQMAGRIDTLVSGYKSFLAHASHELGSPLTRLNIALALARAKAGRALESEHERISKEADRLNNLVQEMLLLALSRAE